MTKAQYGVRKAQVVLPTRDLLIVPHRDGILTVSHPAFGPNTYNRNLTEMQRTYVHSKELPQISFQEPTTSESISAVKYKFRKRTKFKIFDSNQLQAGRILRTSEGVITNPPRNQKGEVILDMKILKEHIDNAKKIKVGNSHIYLGNKDFGFAPYETFQIDMQECAAFAEGGLARVIEHSAKPAKKLRSIASPNNYPRGVNVWGFEPTNKPVERVLNLDSTGDCGGGRLGVFGNWNGNNGGYAFGVR